jgi:thiamine-phosphate pyrophosphorylase
MPAVPDPSVLRILDANADRAREALRVIEDYARFVLGSSAWSAELKQLRHDLTAALAGFDAAAILCRDTPGDVGTSNKTSTETHRDDLSHVVTAAGKRLGEALRAIEEFAKIDHPDAARQIEAVRYRFYDIEQRIARTLGPGERMRGVRLYVLITESCCIRPWLETAEQAIVGGADCLQLREKDLESGELLRRARAMVELCRRHGVISIINDRPDIALLAGADGVHVGQGDLPATEVRKIVGNDRIVGVSTHSIEQARQAVLDGADYIGVGPVYRSPTKPRDIAPGLPFARAAAAEIRIPTIAIAGIDASNAREVAACGVSAIAVTAAVCRAPNPQSAARELKGIMAAVAPQSVGQTFLPVTPGHSCPGVPFDPQSDIRSRRRNLPHWTMQGATYFLTFRATRELSMREREAILQHIRDGDGRFYELFAAVVMPDHAHVLLKPNPDHDLSAVCKGLKGVSARIVNQMSGTSGSVWMDESMDRIVRDAAEFEEKLGYIYHNPVTAGLVGEAEDYSPMYIAPGPS